MSSELEMESTETVTLKKKDLQMPKALNSSHVLWEVQRSFCSYINTRGTRNVKNIGLSLQRGGYITCYQPRGLEGDMVNSLVSFALSV